MAADGLTYGNRIGNFSHNEAHAVVLDAILNTPTYWARINGMGKSFDMPTAQYTVKVSRTNQGQTFQGLEVLNSSASDTTIQLEFNHVGYTHPAVKIMLEHFAVENSGQDIDLSKFIDAEAIAEMNESLGSLVFGTGAGNNINGLEMIVDDGTNSDTIGGQSRSTYSQLNSTVTASGGTLSLSKLATLYTNVSSGMKKPSIGVTDESTWNLLEELLFPSVRAGYGEVGYSKLPVRGSAKDVKRSDTDMLGAGGFTAIFYRGVPIIADEFATSGVLYMLNEDYLVWKGRPRVPASFSSDLEKVSLGRVKNIKNVYDINYKPSENHGWFFLKEQMMPNQAGMIGRYYVIGQLCSANPRYHGKLTGITGV